MEKIGVIKEIDKLGRLVIPKSYRDRLGLGVRVEVVLVDEGVLVRKATAEDDKNDKSGEIHLGAALTRG